MKKGSENTEEATDHHFRHDSEDKIEEEEDEDDDEQDYSDEDNDGQDFSVEDDYHSDDSERGFGANPGPFDDDDDDDDDDVYRTGVNGEASTKSTEEKLIKETILNWPQRSDEPNDEYGVSYLLASSFPT